MARELSEVHVAGATLGVHRHICAFFSSREEEYDVLLPFIAEGLERGEKVVQIMDPYRIDDHCCRMHDAGIDAESLSETEQLELRTWYEGHIAGGKFVQEEMLDLVPELLASPKGSGKPISRVIGQMEWSLLDVPGVDDLVEYESRLNYILSEYDDPVVCVYDVTKYNAAFILDVLRTHPMVIIGSTLQENPFYVAPDVFLEEMKSRQAPAVMC
jgi:hypothetical protein